MASRVLFIAGNISSFDATPIKIYDYLRATSQLLDSPTLVAILDIKNFFNRKRKKEVKEIFSTAGISLKYTVRILPVSILVIWFYKKRGRFEKVYANNLTAGINAFFLKKLFGIRYVFDFHGSIPEERVLIGVWKKDSVKFRMAKKLEVKIASGAKANVAISSKALEYLGCKADEVKNLVIPCGINFDPNSVTIDVREENRKKLGLQNRFVVLYSGSVSPWNDYNEIKRVIGIIREVKKNFMLLILSKDSGETITNFVKQLGLTSDQYTCLSLEHNEVHFYTSCGDLALLVRKKSIVNKISSPMKFGEYIGAGVPVLISSEIGDASTEVIQYELGTVADEIRSNAEMGLFIEDIITNRQLYFDRTRKFAADNYRLSSILAKYNTLYKA